MRNLELSKMEEEITGKVGFDEKSKEEIITKAETMFRIDKDGNAMPEECPIFIYDRGLDKELIEETFLLMDSLKRQKAINKVINGIVNKQNQGKALLQSQIDQETDEKKKKALQTELINKQNTENLEDIKSQINAGMIDEGLKESREIIRQLKEEIKEQKKEKIIKLVPCTTLESYYAFEKRETIEGKDTDDWVADLISKKVSNPNYTLKEAKKLRPDYKIAIKESIMEISGYKVQSYRDLMIELKLKDEKPKTLKKE